MDDLETVRTLLNDISSLLAGKPPQVQGAVLADLLARWLAGHIDLDSSSKTDKLREEILREHLDVIRKLVPVNAKTIGLPH